MKPQTIKNLLTTLAGVGALAILGANSIHRTPTPPKEVARWYEIDSLITQPRFSLEEASQFNPAKNYWTKVEYDSLLAEKGNLMNLGVLEQISTYKKTEETIAKRAGVQILIGFSALLPYFGLIFYKP